MAPQRFRFLHHDRVELLPGVSDSADCVRFPLLPEQGFAVRHLRDELRDFTLQFVAFAGQRIRRPRGDGGIHFHLDSGLLRLSDLGFETLEFHFGRDGVIDLPLNDLSPTVYVRGRSRRAENGKADHDGDCC